ncbi:MAG TPA: MFS transporter [Gaiellaceae bacterium]|nr:MFS transporter [Gaiellaceae bacterium]
MSSGRGRRRRAFAALLPTYLSVFLFSAGASALSVVLPVYLARDAGLGPAAIGGVVGAFAVASLAARLPAGLSYSARRGGVFLVLGGACSAAAFATIPSTTSPAALGALSALNGVGWSVATTAQLALLVARRPGGVSTAEAMGWFSGATALGNVAAGVLGGGVADLVGLRTSFWVLAATPLAGALLMARLAGRPGSEPAGGGRRARTPAWRSLAGLPLAVWVGVLVMFFINGLNAVTNTFHPVLALAAGLSLTQIGALSSVRSWASSSSRFGSGPVFSRIEPASLTLPLVVAGSLATSAIPSVISSFALQVPLFLLAGLSRGLLRVTGSADAFDGAGDDERRHGVTAALLYGGLDLGKVAGPVIGGVVAGAFGIATMFRVVPAGFLVLYLALAIPARRALRPAAGEA